jgi:hypothetical protein
MSRAGGGRATVERGITIDIRHLKRDGLMSGQKNKGTWSWRWAATERLIGLVRYEATIEGYTGTLWLLKSVMIDPSGKPVKMPPQTIRLMATPCRFGGQRWWFLCPHTGRRVMQLHRPYGTQFFSSRYAYRLGYACQREGHRDRAYRRARKARDRIGGSANLSLPLPQKPKWMRWQTYDRHRAACEQAERATLAGMATALEKLRRRIG